MPEMPELYMHRIGRTGRADATGTAISLIAREEEFKVEVEVLMNMELAIDFSRNSGSFIKTNRT
jgi:ATP-dependent RNA helicase RhlE